MSPEVAGLTILALGNGAPDLATSISSIVLAKPFDIVVGGLFGAALFVSSIVVAAVSFIGRHVKLDAPNTIRDIAFYLVAVVGVFFITWDGEVYIYEAVIFLVYYFGYVAFACITHYCGFCKPQKEEENTLTKPVASTSINANGDYDRLSDPDDGLLGGAHSRDGSYGSISDKARLLDSGETKTGDDSDDEDDETPFSFRLWWAWFLSKPLLKRIYIAISSLVILPMYLSVPTIKWNRYNHAISLPGSIVVLYLALGYLPVLATERKYWISFTVCMIIATALAIVMFFTTKRDQPPKYKPVFVLLSFVISIAWIAMIADELVSVLQAMGVILGVPTFVLGATVLAWGNSVPDLVADIVMAQKGFPGSALSAAWGGPMLNMLIGMGIGFCIRCAVLFPNPVVVEASKSFLAAGGFLFVILYGTLIVLWIRKFTLDWWLGAALVVIYLLFNLFTGLIEGKVMWKGPVPV
jgi:sodium/potassium/calcium exchanger 6